MYDIQFSSVTQSCLILCDLNELQHVTGRYPVSPASFIEGTIPLLLSILGILVKVQFTVYVSMYFCAAGSDLLVFY